VTAPITENLNHLATVLADAVIEGRDAGIYRVKPPDLHRQGDL